MTAAKRGNRLKHALATVIVTAILFGASAASAATVVVLPDSSGWSRQTGGSTAAAITGTEGRSGNGSLELRGDASRFVFGGTSFLASSLGKLGNMTGLTFDWRLAGDSAGALNVDYTPALRLHIKSGFTTRELIWEGAYNGVYGDQTVPDTWYSTTTSGLFYSGRGNENNGKTIATWAAEMASWDVIGISVGHGSGAGSGYHAFADNVTFATKSGSTTYNFEASLANAAVPEPATWGLMLTGFGMVGAGLRSRRRTVTYA